MKYNIKNGDSADNVELDPIKLDRLTNFLEDINKNGVSRSDVLSIEEFLAYTSITDKYTSNYFTSEKSSVGVKEINKTYKSLIKDNNDVEPLISIQEASVSIANVISRCNRVIDELVNIKNSIDTDKIEYILTNDIKQYDNNELKSILDMDIFILIYELEYKYRELFNTNTVDEINNSIKEDNLDDAYVFLKLLNIEEFRHHKDIMNINIKETTLRELIDKLYNIDYYINMLNDIKASFGRLIKDLNKDHMSNKSYKQINTYVNKVETVLNDKYSILALKLFEK